MEAVVPVLVLCSWITFVVVCIALFCAIIGGLFVWQYGVKLREYKPQGFLISDIAAGAYKLRQTEDGAWELKANVEEEDDSEDGLASEDEFAEWMGERK